MNECRTRKYNVKCIDTKPLKQSNDIALVNKSSYSYGVSLAIWDYTVLSATRYK